MGRESNLSEAGNTIRQIAGNVVADPEERDGEYGKWATFRVAVSRTLPAEGEKYGESRFYGVSVNREALVDDVMARIKKGTRVTCEGVAKKVSRDGTDFYNFKAWRVGLVDYLGFAQSIDPDEGEDITDEDEDDF
jgi:hypothetical protein